MRLQSCLALLVLTACSAAPRANSPTSTPGPAALSSPVEPRSATATPIARPTAEPAAVPSASPEAPAKLLFTTYSARLVEGQLPLVVYLPQDFDPANRTYPVIYLLHGVGFDQGMWADLGVRAELERVRPAVAVMPFIPPPLLSGSDGGPNSYEAELVEGLMPQIESRFGLEPAPRAIAGISRGGVWALEIALRHPAEFQAVAALSPSLHLNRSRGQYDPYQIVIQGGPFPAPILLMAGEQERQTREALELLAADLEAASAEYRLVIQPGKHDESLWRQQVGEVLTVLTGEP